MSTKTSIKRIALVAAAALTLGGFTAVSAHATAPAFTSTSTAITGNYDAVAVAAGTSDNYYKITSSGVGTLVVPATGGATGDTSNYTINSSTSVLWYGGVAVASTPFTNQVLNFAATSSDAGTQTIKITGDVSGAVTYVITWSAAHTFNAGLSTVRLASGTTAEAVSGTDDTVSALKGASGQVANIKVTINNEISTGFNGVALSAAVSGAGLVSANWATGTTLTGNSNRAITLGAVGYQKNAVYTAASMAGNVAVFGVASDGNAGTATITISATDPVTSASVVLATKTVTFTGSITSVKSVGNLKVLKAGSTTYTGAATAAAATNYATTVALTGFAVDSNGNGATGTVKIVSSDPTVLTAGSCQAATGAKAKTGEYNCIVDGFPSAASGKTATITFEAQTAADVAAGTYSILATPVTFTIGGSPVAVKLSTDQSQYTPGAAGSLVITAKDSAGNAAADGDYSNLLGGTLVSTVANPATTMPTVAQTLIGGVATSDIYAPVSEGDFTISGTTGSSTGSGSGAAISVTATVSGTSASAGLALDAANAATDAANNAYDEAQNATQAASDALAAVTALSAQVSALIATVKSLAAMVAKIKAKVKA